MFLACVQDAFELELTEFSILHELVSQRVEERIFGRRKIYARQRSRLGDVSWMDLSSLCRVRRRRRAHRQSRSLVASRRESLKLSSFCARARSARAHLDRGTRVSAKHFSNNFAHALLRAEAVVRSSLARRQLDRDVVHRARRRRTRRARPPSDLTSDRAHLASDRRETRSVVLIPIPPRAGCLSRFEQKSEARRQSSTRAHARELDARGSTSRSPSRHGCATVVAKTDARDDANGGNERGRRRSVELGNG